MTQILLVEDEKSLGETLRERLQKEGYSVSWAETYQQATETWNQRKFDLVILDVGLPDGNGFDLAEKIQRRAPIIFMTAMNSAENRLRGYDVGAEEFIPKPFHLREMLMRIQHVLENHALRKKIKLDSCTVDLESLVIDRVDGSSERLQTRDAELLRLLVDRHPSVVSRDEILNRIWGEDKFPSQRTVDNSIVRLRAAIGDKDGQLIVSVRGVGYQWNGGT